MLTSIRLIQCVLIALILVSSACHKTHKTSTSGKALLHQTTSDSSSSKDRRKLSEIPSTKIEEDFPALDLDLMQNPMFTRERDHILVKGESSDTWYLYRYLVTNAYMLSELGQSISDYSEVSLLATGSYDSQGRMTGIWTMYDRRPVPDDLIIEYKEGQRHGMVSSRYLKGSYTQGKKDGVWIKKAGKCWSKDNKHTTTTTYDHGKIVSAHYSSGQPLIEGSYTEDGKKDGIWRAFHADGTEHFMLHYNAGEIVDGQYVRRNAGGKPTITYGYNGGRQSFFKRTGLVYYANLLTMDFLQVKTVFAVDDEKIIKQTIRHTPSNTMLFLMEYDKNQKPKDGFYEEKSKDFSSPEIYTHRTYSYKHGMLQGVYNVFYPNGQQKISLMLKDDVVMDGSYKSYYDDGSVRDSFTIKDGKLHGLYQAFHENGTTRREVMFSRGFKTGEQKKWTPRGVLSEKSTYSDGILQGPHVSYYADIIVEQGSYEMGRRQGYWLITDKSVGEKYHVKYLDHRIVDGMYTIDEHTDILYQNGLPVTLTRRGRTLHGQKNVTEVTTFGGCYGPIRTVMTYENGQVALDEEQDGTIRGKSLSIKRWRPDGTPIQQ